MAPKRESPNEDGQDGRASQNRDNTTVAMGQETDPVLRRFGHIAEGFFVTGRATHAERVLAQRRYLNRRQLAELANLPEGFEFPHGLRPGSEQQTTLLTPPDMVAVRRANGSWYRRPRNVDEDGAEPYSMEFYLEYLRSNNLPYYFLRPEHIATYNLPTEGLWLGGNDFNPPAPVYTLPARDYLKRRYQQEAQRPRAGVLGQVQAFGLDMEAEDGSRVRASYRVEGLATYYNPSRQPDGPGRWEYFTTSDRDAAWANFGGQAAFPNDTTPSAASMWRLRQQYRAARARGDAVEDYTADINLVWVPGEDSEESDSGEDPEEPGLIHDPRNRGINDQTGAVGRTHYDTLRMDDGRSYTVDRARAHAGNPEPHKSWIVGKKGAWRQWPGYSALNWNDKNRVEVMNKWREQELTRNGWPKKRPTPRTDYTEGQRDWLFEYVKRAKGGRPANISMEELTQLFNAKFGQTRNVTGLTGVYDRLRGEWKTHGGHRKPIRRRGDNNKNPNRAPSDNEDSEPEKEGEGDEDDA